MKKIGQFLIDMAVHLPIFSAYGKIKKRFFGFIRIYFLMK